ncbi:MAG: CidA/LrgA family protein [Actinomycetes bacterium]|nr:CidA/LrgA family protein [Actinomycetes bacterium]
MRFLKQAAIILAITAAGELLRAVIPAPIPAGVYGMVLLLVLLLAGVVRPAQVETVSDRLMEIMPLLFVPLIVGVVSQWAAVRVIWPALLIVAVLGTFLVIAAAGWTTQLVLRVQRRRRK